MTRPIILASGSDIRSQLLRNAQVPFTVIVPRVDEDTIRESLLAEGTTPRDVADALAEAKATKVSIKHPRALVIGCDQVLDFRGEILTKPHGIEDARTQLTGLRGNRHSLLSAVVICCEGRPIWRHIGQVRLTMRGFSDGYLESYLGRNWDSIQHAVGAYKLEEEGVRLFSRVEGDYFNVLGLPLLELLAYLTLSGDIKA